MTRNQQVINWMRNVVGLSIMAIGLLITALGRKITDNRMKQYISDEFRRRYR